MKKVMITILMLSIALVSFSQGYITTLSKEANQFGIGLIGGASTLHQPFYTVNNVSYNYGIRFMLLDITYSSYNTTVAENTDIIEENYTSFSAALNIPVYKGLGVRIGTTDATIQRWLFQPMRLTRYDEVSSVNYSIYYHSRLNKITTLQGFFGLDTKGGYVDIYGGITIGITLSPMKNKGKGCGSYR